MAVSDETLAHACEGYESTVEALQHAQWQITGIARNLVDAADDRARQPAPSPHFLARYADALDALADVVTDFGLRDDDARARFDRQVGHAEEILAALRELVRATPLGGPRGVAGLRVAHHRRAACGPRARIGQIARCEAHR